MDNGEGLKLKEKAKLTTEAYAKRALVDRAITEKWAAC